MFETEHFRITETELQLLRSKFAFKKIPFEQLQRVQLTRGYRVKYPIRTLIFGIVIIAISVYVLSLMGEFRFPRLGETNDPRSSLLILIIFSTLILTGSASIYVSTVRTGILRAKLDNGTWEVLELIGLKKTNDLYKLERFLKSKLPNNILQIDNKWNE